MQRGDASVIVSVITEAELIVKPEKDGNTEAIERIGDLLSEDGIYVIDVNRRIARKAASLRAQSGLKLPDAIIVATAIQTACEAVVGNDGAWRRLTEIPFVDLGELAKST